MTIYERLLEVAAGQRGLVTTQDAVAIGVAPVELRKLTQRGKLTRVSHGLYRLTTYPYREHDDLMAAALWPIARGVISHQTALALWGLADVNPAKIDVTVPLPYRPRRDGGDKYRVWAQELNPAEIDYVDDIPVVLPERAITDAARAGLQPRFVEQAIDAALRRGLFGQPTATRLRKRILQPVPAT